MISYIESSKLPALKSRIKTLENKKLSGGIVGRNLKISDNGMGELTLTGDFKITIKVFDLTSSNASKLTSMINYTRSFISSLLNQPVYEPMVQYFRYDSKQNMFNLKQTTHFAVRYNFKFTVDIFPVTGISQISGNDFVIAVVDGIGARFKDKFGLWHSEDGFSNKNAPCIIDYNSWTRDPTIAAHEFFHTLSLGDKEDPEFKENIMYHLGGSGKTVNMQQKIDLTHYIIDELRNMTSSNYQIQSLNTVVKLRTFLNDPSNAVRYNINRFR